MTSPASPSADISQFTIDWENQQVICPQGKNSIYWKDTKRYGQPKILAKFDRDDCQVCPSKTLCTRSRTGHRNGGIRRGSPIRKGCESAIPPFEKGVGGFIAIFSEIAEEAQAEGLRSHGTAGTQRLLPFFAKV